MKRTIIGPQDLGSAHHIVEVGANNIAASGPFAQPAIAPEDHVIAIEQHHAVGHALQNTLILHEAGDIDDFREMVGVSIDADVFSCAELAEGPHRRDLDALHVFAKALLEHDLGIVSATETENLRRGKCSRGGTILSRWALFVHDLVFREGRLKELLQTSLISAPTTGVT